MSHKPPSEPLRFYEADSPETLARLKDVFSHGALKDTGKIIISAVDQGFEHGPTRSFCMNLDAFDPHYHYQLAVDAGLSAFAAPLGLLESGAKTFKGKIPTILKLNSGNALIHLDQPDQALTASVEDAVRLGCHGVGVTFYPGSAHSYSMIEKIQKISLEARKAGLFVVIWSYPRGNMSKQGETALDVVSYGAHMACLLGGHIIKVKVPTAHLEKQLDKQSLEEHHVPIQTLKDRIRYVVRSCFNGRRVVIFSGGDVKTENDLLSEIQAIHQGGGFGSIVGRNLFQRSRQESLSLIEKIVNVYKSKDKQ
jgi:fructose-bisphosphate aldolase, class I